MKPDRKMHLACQQGALEEIRALIAKDPELLEVLNQDQEAPLVTAVVAEQLEVLQLLLGLGANPCAQSGFALNCAIYRGALEMVQLLLAAGANAVLCDVPHWHGLHIACGWGAASQPNLEMVKLLIEHGAEPHRVFEGKTPIAYAEMRSQTAIIEYLSML